MVKKKARGNTCEDYLQELCLATASFASPMIIRDEKPSEVKYDEIFDSYSKIWQSSST